MTKLQNKVALYGYGWFGSHIGCHIMRALHRALLLGALATAQEDDHTCGCSAVPRLRVIGGKVVPSVVGDLDCQECVAAVLGGDAFAGSLRSWHADYERLRAGGSL
jgi:hypothetical protein